ncbi:MAG: right-handed parallel beta-helix repeat-containing protein [Fibrobacterota bacterium]|nr:MAG: right-handed parallel beta-helix repeat-containing protein [Fibrobacterota bacterium]
MRNSITYVSIGLVALLFAGLGVGCGGDSVGRDDSPSPVSPLPDTATVAFVEPPVSGRTFWIDPVGGSPDGDGSAQRPWRTLQEVLDRRLVAYYGRQSSGDPQSPWVLHDSEAPVQGGDRLVLKSGYHGLVRRSQFCFRKWLHIEAAPGDTPVLSQFLITGTFEKIHLKGLRFRKEDWIPSDTAKGDERLWWKAQAINNATGTLLELRNGLSGTPGREVVLQNLDLRSARDVSKWSAADWVDRAASGITVRSARKVSIHRCHLENVRFGISIFEGSDSSMALDNLVRRYSGDGFRLTSDWSRLERNRVEGCMKVDDNHDDGIQSWSSGEDGSLGNGIVRGNILRDNVIVGILDSTDPLRGSPQGIGAFDGFFESWVVERNVIVSNTHHGITFYGMRNSRISHNTVIDQVPGDDISPGIYVRAHKDGRESENVTLNDNLAMADASAKGPGMTESGNMVIGKFAFQRLAWLFVDAFNGDVRLRSNDSTRAFLGSGDAGASRP